MKHIKLFEDFNDYVPLDEIILHLGIPDNIEIAIAICEE